MKIALVHDYLNEAGGAERVLRVLADMYPKASIYTAFAKHGTAYAMFGDRRIIESPWAWFLKIGRFYSYFRFFIPYVWKSVDLTGYDLVITSTAGGYIARGFRVRSNARVVAYCHTPPKWLYGYETPTGAMGKWWGQAFMVVFGPPLRYFDFQSAQRVNTWIANSQEVARRIEKFYRKKSIVVYPPVEINDPTNQQPNKRGDYYLLVTRVTGAKGVLEAAEAAKRGHFKLKLVGEVVEGRLRRQLADASGYVELVGRVSDAELGDLYARAKGFIALAHDEDFGMTVVEAMACGTPVLAYHGGGYLETVKPGVTGLFVTGTGAKAVVSGVREMERTMWDRAVIRAWAMKFSREEFEKQIRRVVGY